MTSPDINQLARGQAVLEERMESRHKEQASGLERLATMLASYQAEQKTWREATEAKRDAERKADEARRQADEAKRDAERKADEARWQADEAKRQADFDKWSKDAAKRETRTVIWLIGWVTAMTLLTIAVLNFMLLRDQPPQEPKPAAAQPAAIVEEVATPTPAAAQPATEDQAASTVSRQPIEPEHLVDSGEGLGRMRGHQTNR